MVLTALYLIAACDTIVPIPPSIVAIFVSRTSGFAGVRVTFSVDTDGLVEEWEWDFDNDGTVDSTRPSASTLKVTVTPAKPAVLDVKIAAMDGGTGIGPVVSHAAMRKRAVRTISPVTIIILFIFPSLHFQLLG